MAKKTQSIKQKQCHNKFNEDFKNGPHTHTQILKKENVCTNLYNIS